MSETQFTDDTSMNYKPPIRLRWSYFLCSECGSLIPRFGSSTDTVCCPVCRENGEQS